MERKPQTSDDPRVERDANESSPTDREMERGKKEKRTKRPIQRAAAPPADPDWPAPSKDTPPEK